MFCVHVRSFLLLLLFDSEYFYSLLYSFALALFLSEWFIRLPTSAISILNIKIYLSVQQQQKWTLVGILRVQNFLTYNRFRAYRNVTLRVHTFFRRYLLDFYCFFSHFMCVHRIIFFKFHKNWADREFPTLCSWKEQQTNNTHVKRKLR